MLQSVKDAGKGLLVIYLQVFDTMKARACTFILQKPDSTLKIFVEFCNINASFLPASQLFPSCKCRLFIF